MGCRMVPAQLEPGASWPARLPTYPTPLYLRTLYPQTRLSLTRAVDLSCIVLFGACIEGVVLRDKYVSICSFRAKPVVFMGFPED